LNGHDNFQIIQAVQAANDIVDVVGEYVALKRSGKNFTGLCPFHHEKTPSFNVSPDRQIFKCFGCGVGGDVIKFVQNILKVDFWQAIEFLAQRAGIPVPEKGKTVKTSSGEVTKVDIFNVNHWACDFYSKILWDTEEGRSAREYLARRGLREEIIRQFRLGFSPNSGRALIEAAGKKGFKPTLLSAAGLITNKYNSYNDLFRGRVLFPIFDVTGNVVAFGGRTMGDDQPKYLNTPETPVFVKQRNLFGLYQARETIQEKKQVVVVEGYMDCIAPYQCGVKNVVAALGTALNEQHVQNLRRYADAIVLIFDADLAGRNASDRALNVFLSLGVDVKLACVTSGKDPCDLVISEGGEAFQRVIDGAVGALEYKWQQLQKRYHTVESEKERRDAIDDLLRTVATCDPYGRVDVIQRGMILTQLASMLSVPSEEIGLLLQKYRRRSFPQAASAEGESAEQNPRRILEAISENPVHGAFRVILEVLISEPGYISMVSETFSPADFEPAVCREIAEKLWQCSEKLGEFSLSELLGTVEAADLADIITQLYKEGSSKGNFPKTLEEAMRCITDSRTETAAVAMAVKLDGSQSDEEADRQLQLLAEQLSKTVRRVPGALVE
jgi:DNA primase